MKCGCLFICNLKANPNWCEDRKECYCKKCSTMTLKECEATTIRHSK